MHVTWTYVSNPSSACEADGRGASAPQTTLVSKSCQRPQLPPQRQPDLDPFPTRRAIRHHASGYAPRWGLRPGAVQGGFLPLPPPRSRWVVSVLVTPPLQLPSPATTRATLAERAKNGKFGTNPTTWSHEQARREGLVGQWAPRLAAVDDDNNNDDAGRAVTRSHGPRRYRHDQRGQPFR